MKRFFLKILIGGIFLSGCSSPTPTPTISPNDTFPTPTKIFVVDEPLNHFTMEDNFNGDFLYRAPIQTPTSSAWGPDGYLYIADFIGRRIARMTKEGEISEVELKTGIFYDDGPRTLAFSPDGVLYVNTHSAIYWVDENLEAHKVPRASGSPLGSIAFSPDGDLYYTNRHPSNGGVRLWKTDKTEFIVENMPFADTMVFGLDGTLYLSAMNDKNVYKVDVATHELSIFYTLPMDGSFYLTVDSEGNIWVRGLELLLKLTPEGIELPYILDGTTYVGVILNPRMMQAAQIAFEQDGSIWVPSYNSHILKYTLLNTDSEIPEYSTSAIYPGLYFGNLATNSKDELFGTEQFTGNLIKIKEDELEIVANYGCAGTVGLAIDQFDNIFVGACQKILQFDGNEGFVVYAEVETERMTFGTDGLLYAISGTFNTEKSLVRINGNNEIEFLASEFDGIPLGNGPVTLAATDQGLYVYKMEGDDLFEVDFTGQGHIRTLNKENVGFPVFMTANQKGDVVIIEHGSYDLTKFDESSNPTLIATHIMGDPWSFAWSSDDQWLYMGEAGGVIRIQMY